LQSKQAHSILGRHWGYDLYILILWQLMILLGVGIAAHSRTKRHPGPAQLLTLQKVYLTLHPRGGRCAVEAHNGSPSRGSSNRWLCLKIMDSMCIYIYMCVFVCVYIYIYVIIYMCVCNCIYIHKTPKNQPAWCLIIMFIIVLHFPHQNCHVWLAILLPLLSSGHSAAFAGGIG
jgi:hypothetical protein